MNYKELSGNPGQFPAMTGYTAGESGNLLPHFKFESDREPGTGTLTGKCRVKRSHSGYRNSPLPGLRDNLLFILIYPKQGMTREAPAVRSGMHRPDADRRIHFLHPVLNRSSAAAGERPVGNADLSDPGNERKNFFYMTEPDVPLSVPKTEMTGSCISGVKKSGILLKIFRLSIPYAESSFPAAHVREKTR